MLAAPWILVIRHCQKKNSRPEAQVSGLCFCFTPGLEAGNIFSRTIAR
ncbi:Hypothetical protein, conserved [Brucella ceti str. Cudo]|uniref:Uncharacterized protein n=1 Tax=Brucella ceti str. Cudo TaxID=595497 RepID=C0G5B1_9HYPH|nr:Hypothetical protein, conserved [Brucella ceti str. Cudo]